MVIYNGPVGEPVENPNESFIKDIFFNKNDENKEVEIHVLRLKAVMNV